MNPKVVLDTSVLIAGLRSSRGASHRVLRLVDRGQFDLALSVPLVAEYEAVSKRQSRQIGLSHTDIDDILDFMCASADLREIYFLWRPILRDSNDDHVLELAVEANCSHIVTFNVRDFGPASTFGVQVVTPVQFLAILES
jgi:putative PIN family toxin of toxin-antitoxin system